MRVNVFYLCSSSLFCCLARHSEKKKIGSMHRSFSWPLAFDLLPFTLFAIRFSRMTLNL